MTPSEIKYPEIAKELVALKESDQAMRQKMRSGSDWDKEVDIKNTERLKSVINEIGWPTISKVGTEAAFSSWLLVQHADLESEFQAMCLDLMKEAGSDVAPDWVAMLEDRVRVNTGKSQLYGTQFYTDKNGVFGPRPIEDIDNLEIRRKSVGLGTFTEYQAQMEKVNQNWVEARKDKKN
jgi:hypothetical protein